MEVFHASMRWEGRGSGFESSSGAAGIGKSRTLSPLGLRLKNEQHGCRTAWLITGQKFKGVGLKLKTFILAFRDGSSHLCQTIMRVAV